MSLPFTELQDGVEDPEALAGPHVNPRTWPFCSWLFGELRQVCGADDLTFFATMTPHADRFRVDQVRGLVLNLRS